jgi:mitochondrial import inner membrane translocase subunit TIM22
MASPEPSAAGTGAGGESASQAPVVEPIHMPTQEEIRGQDIWNNCAVKSVVSGVIGNYAAPVLRLCI